MLIRSANPERGDRRCSFFFGLKMSKKEQLPILASQFPTMTSREIAELTGKDLSHIHRDTRAMLDELAESDDPDLDHVCEEKDSRGYTTCFHLPKGLTFRGLAYYNEKEAHAAISSLGATV